MTIPELLARLTKLWPLGGTDAWQDEYRRLLKPFAGPALDRAWDGVMATWDKGFPPKPADIRKHCRHERRGEAKHVEGAENWARVERRCEEMIDDWFRDHPDIGAECQRDAALLGLVRNRVYKICWSAAQFETLGVPDPWRRALERHGKQNIVSAEEMQKMRELVESWGRGPKSETFKQVAA